MNKKLLSFKLIFILFVLTPTISFAHEKGILFKIGEYILNLDGVSYTKLEAETIKVTKQLSERELDIKDCASYAKFNLRSTERSIGFNVADILSAGCTGTLKQDLIKFGGHSSPEGQRTDNFEGEIQVTTEPRFKHLMVSPIKQNIQQHFPHSPFSAYRSELYPFDNQSGIVKFPPIILERTYEINDERSGGTLKKGTYKIKYNVTKNANNQLEVTAEGDVAEAWSHMPISQKYTYKLFCTGKTLEELNAIATELSKTK